MNCPVCAHEETKVVDSRISADGAGIRRRRECEKCQYRFSTVEEVELLDLTVVKRDGHREAYAREKLERGLKKALEKRPITDAEFRSLIHGIEQDIQRLKSEEVSSNQLGEFAMNRLQAFDHVAYIRFASVCRQFEDVESFQHELANLIAARKQKKK